jgi:nucleoside 2-deoxyribosyltransferase
VTVYLAGPYAARDLLGRYARELEQIGYHVGTRWLAEDHSITPGTEGAAVDLADEQAAQHAMDDLADILLAFTAASVLPADERVKRGTSGGRHIETGYALALNKPVVLVGDAENVFHRMPHVTRVPDWHDAVVEMAARLVGHERDLPRDVVGVSS